LSNYLKDAMRHYGLASVVMGSDVPVSHRT